MKPFFAVVIFTILPLVAFSQKYEYINMVQVKAGFTDKVKIQFDWPSRVDSMTYYSDLKIKNMITAIQTMEGKGFELVTINEYGPGNLVIISSAYMRRRK